MKTYEKSSNFAYFPEEEYKNRYKKLSGLMDKYNIDFLIVTSKENISYFTGYNFGELEIDDKYFHCFGVLPGDMSLGPTLVVGEGNEGSASMSWIKDRRFFKYSRKQFMGLQYIDSLSEVIKEKGLDRSNMGLELGSGMSLKYDFFSSISQVFDPANIIDASELIWDLRKIKSTHEIKAIKKSCDITGKGYIKGFEALGEGVTEKHIASIMGSSMIQEGADCFGTGIVMFYSGKDRGTWCDGLPSDYILKKGDLAQVDGGFAYKGYKSDIMRMACIGNPTREQEHNYNIAREASTSSIAAIKEGVSCNELWKVAEKVWLKNGFEDFVRNRKKSNWCSIGHGIGLDIHEPPSISLGENEILKSGMVITIEAFNTHNGSWPLKDALWWYVIEDIILVNKNGYNILSDIMDNGLWIA